MTAPPPSIVPILATPFGVVPLPAAEALNPNLVAVAITTGPNNLDPRVRTDDTSQKIAR